MDDPTTAATRRLIREFVDAVNGHDTGRLEGLLQEGVVFHGPLAASPSVGRNAVGRFYEERWRAVPDLQASVVEMAVEADRAVVRSTLRGTHRGALAGFPASGRSFEGVDDCGWYRVADGRIAELWLLPTSAHMLEKLRLMPSGPPPRLLVWLLSLKNGRGVVSAAPQPPPAVRVELRPGERGGAEKFLVRKGLLEFFGGRRFETFDELFAPDEQILSKIDAVEGKAAVLALYRKVLGAFPDLYFTIDDMVSEGELVGARVTARGTQLGSLEGLPPTGRRYEATEVFMEVVRGGRIQRQWHFVNFEAMLQQLGLAPPGPPPLPMRLLMRFLASRQEKPKDS
jgi:steroid delta-isomerase-like uncharacterized protein